MSLSSARTVHLKVTAYGLWQMKLGRKNMRFGMKEGTLKDLIMALAEANETDLAETMTHKGRLAEGLLVFVNGTPAHDLATPLREGDEVVLYSMFDGG